MMSRTSPWNRDHPDGFFEKHQAKQLQQGRDASAQGTEGVGTLHLQGMPFDGGAAPDLLIGAVDPVVPGIRLAPGHCDHPDTLEAIPVNPWAEGQRPVPAGAAHVPALGTTA